MMLQFKGDYRCQEENLELCWKSPLFLCHIEMKVYEYCKRGNIRGTLIFADFAVFQQARIQKPAKIFAIFCMHILDT